MNNFSKFSGSKKSGFTLMELMLAIGIGGDYSGRSGDDVELVGAQLGEHWELRGNERQLPTHIGCFRIGCTDG